MSLTLSASRLHQLEATERMLTRPLLYTAITRARNSCVLVGDQISLAAAVRRDDSGGRHSGLAERLRG